ncbi:unnamed protein product [Prorocentrum cordatum]|uniref:tRNA/rRNA methyltransferase SpoU type domain-containing protein n=1 Tax=Prorocentrum cordatum TaxID=2364126 RepID=A0ABN9Y6F5_9DINO|nr:unnamed protein product [Polarella glacialis]
MGWLYRMDCHLAEPLTRSLEELKRMGIRVLAAENQFSQPVAQHPPPGRDWALVVGHEGRGISAAVVAASDACVCVPQEQGMCLNVSHAAAICMYELSRGYLGAGGAGGL